jgi:TonB family protein
MSLRWTGGAFDILGLAQPCPAQPPLPGQASPQLEVAWGSFHQGLKSSLAALLRAPFFARRSCAESYLRNCWVEGGIPWQAIAAAALWHIVFVVLPYPRFPSQPRPVGEDKDWELTWSGSIKDLPLLNLPARKPKLRGQRLKPPARGADAFHPRQTIISDPVRPTHPRQTLINPAARAEAPKLLPDLPNIVQLTRAAEPAKPRLEISSAALEKLHPQVQLKRQASDVAAPDLPNRENRVADMSFAASPNVPAKPKLQLNASSAPRLASRREQSAMGAAPELAASMAGSDSAPAVFVALSATPAPPAPAVQVPGANLAARFTISPEGPRPGAPDGVPNGVLGTRGGTETSAAGVSINGGNPSAVSPVSGLGKDRPLVGVPRTLLGWQGLRPSFSPATDMNRGTAVENAIMHSGAKPEAAFGARHVYRLYVNMPNLNSVTGSWVLNFVELVEGEAQTASGELSGPVPLRKVDPRYPPALVSEKVEGEVVVYAIIRKDGSVDSIQLIHGIDEQLDRNAMEALSNWKFRPAARQGVAVELEAIVHIPFRAVVRPY